MNDVIEYYDGTGTTTPCYTQYGSEWVRFTSSVVSIDYAAALLPYFQVRSVTSNERNFGDKSDTIADF